MTNKICAKIQEGRKTTCNTKNNDWCFIGVGCRGDLVEAANVRVWQYAWYWPDMMSGHGRRLSWCAGTPSGWSPLARPPDTPTTELTSSWSQTRIKTEMTERRTKSVLCHSLDLDRTCTKGANNSSDITTLSGETAFKQQELTARNLDHVASVMKPNHFVV